MLCWWGWVEMEGIGGGCNVALRVSCTYLLSFWEGAFPNPSYCYCRSPRILFFFFVFFSLLCTYFLSHPVFYYTYASESCTALARLHLTLCSRIPQGREVHLFNAALCSRLT